MTIATSIASVAFSICRTNSVVDYLAENGGTMINNTDWYGWCRNPTQIWEFKDKSRIAIDKNGISVY